MQSRFIGRLHPPRRTLVAPTVQFDDDDNGDGGGDGDDGSGGGVMSVR